MTRRPLSFIFALMLVLFAVVPAGAAPTFAPQCFQVPGITDCIDGRFAEYWNTNGGLPVFGYPITPQRPEQNRDTQQTYQTQTFERNRFELHPENRAPYDVLLGRLGAESLAKQGRGFEGIPAGTTPQGRCRNFDVGGKPQAVCDPFLRYWEANGLEFDGKPGKSYDESLALFGLPLTYPKMETNPNGDTVMIQYFERARFEDHGAKGVLLGLLGREMMGATPPPPPPPPPGDTLNQGDCSKNAPAPVEGAQAYMTNAEPQRGTNTTLCVRLTLQGRPVAGATVLGVVAYPTGPFPLAPIVTDAAGIAGTTFTAVGTVGSRVQVNVDVIYKDTEYSTSTSFTPR